MKIIMLDNQLQELTTDTCGIFQLYFYKNLFDPDSDSKMLNDEFIKKKRHEQHCLMKFFQQISKQTKKK